MLFYYKAKTKEGEIIEKIVEASDKFSLAHEIRSGGNTPISITEKKKNSFEPGEFFKKFLGKISIQELIIFTKNLSGMLHAGLAVSRALSVLKKQTKNDKMLAVLNELGEEIDSGGTLSSGLAKFPKIFSKLFISMVRAGEESGNLSGALSEIGGNLEKSHAITKKVKGALIYPSIILILMVLIGILMFAFVVPTLAKTFKDTGAELPATTKFIISVGDFFSQNLLTSIISFFIIFIGAYFLFNAKFMAKYFDLFILKLPFIGEMSRELNTARTARTISSLLVSGVPIIRSIEIAEDVVQNIYYKKVLAQAIEEIEKGAPFSEIFVLNTNLYPVMMSEMVQVGEETGKLSDMLLQVALFYEGEIENRTKNLSTIIEPVLMAFIGVAVGFFAISMISPMYSMMDNIK